MEQNQIAATQGDNASPAATVLVVEDEVLIRAATGHYLRGCGFQVLEAAHADEALDILAADRSVQLVFSDVRLPGSRNGVDLARIVRTTYPDKKVLLTTGVTPFPAVDGVTLLKKPYFLVDLEREIRALLRSAGAPGFGGRAFGRPGIPGQP